MLQSSQARPPKTKPMFPTWIGILVLVSLLAAMNSQSVLKFIRGTPADPEVAAPDVGHSRPGGLRASAAGSTTAEPITAHWRQHSVEETQEKVVEVLLYGFEEVRGGRRAGKKLRKDFDGEMVKKSVERIAVDQVRSAAQTGGGGARGAGAGAGAGAGSGSGDVEVMDSMVMTEEERFLARRKREVKDRYDWVYSVVLSSQGVSRGTKFSATTGIQVWGWISTLIPDGSGFLTFFLLIFLLNAAPGGRCPDV